MSDVLKKLSEKPSFDGKEVKDKLGRSIILRKPDIMDRFFLLRAMGADASNSSLVGMMMPTIYVAAIDGAPFPTPRTALECEAALKRMNDEGWESVTKEINRYFSEIENEALDTVKK